ncbi:hypothetical protein AB4Y40_22890 [Paraburkholderia sp. EG287B]|uniref:hypothetical protein n=1 Tax=unclassified Paraburkholderia TaxID=2615204 RepID=UPI0034D19B11
MTLKHEPIDEFRSAAYVLDNPSDTLLCVPGGAIKAAMADAAKDLPGKVAAAQIGRLTTVPVEMVGVYGIPKILMSVVRNSDINRTPDIRSRCILERWCLVFPVAFITPNLSDAAIVRLLAAAGMIRGIGDFRVEKGAGSYGQFRVCDPDDEEFVEIRKQGGRKVQEQAMHEPLAYNAETQELLSWFGEEVQRRRQQAADTPKKGKRGKADAPDESELATEAA